MKSHLTHRSRGGMVLFELIIALTIFALVTVGLVTALDRAFEVSADRKRSDDAVHGLRNQLAILRAEPLVPGERDLPGDGTGIAYHVSIAPVPASDERKQPILGLERATITARWDEGNSTGNHTITALFYHP